MKQIQKVFGVAIFATLFLILSCAPSGELGPEEGASGIQTDQSKATPPPTQPPPTQPPPVEPPPAEPPPAQPTGEFTQGTIRTFFGDGSPEVIESPSALAIDSNDNLFVFAQRRIPDPTAFGGIGTEAEVYKITPVKEISVVKTKGQGGRPVEIALDSQGNLFVLEVQFPDQFQSQNISALHKTSPDGTQTILANNLTFPGGLLVREDGRIIVSQGSNNVVEVPPPGGAFKLIAGKIPGGFSGDGGPATQAFLNGPGGIAVDSLGRFFICDTGNRRVRMVDTNGIINTVLGPDIFVQSSPSTFPIKILIHPSLTMPLITTETTVMAVDGTVIAGNGTFGFSGDGGPADAAQLSKIAGLAIDSKGFLYISDFSNNRIRIVNPKRGAGTPFK